MGVHQPIDADHGRIETRTATVLTDIAWLQADHRWPGLAAVGKIVRVRQCGPKTTTETAYYLFSTALCAERFNQVAREHWSVENRLHWRLDVVMNEDQDRTRLGNGPQNLAVLRHMALNVMQKDGSKESLRGNSKGQAETTLSSPACSGCFEMRLPWSCQRMRLPSWCHRLKPDGERISRAVQRVTSRQIKLARTDRSSHDPRHATTREAALCQTETSRARTRPDRRCRVSSGAGYAS